jgi:penicillin-binding protein 1A
LPVEVWSRFMKVAHQGVPVADLPGLTVGQLIAALPPANIPSAPMATDSSRPQPVASRGLDGWFLDKLFGRK